MMVLKLDSGAYLDVLDGVVPVTVQSLEIGNLASRVVNTTTSFRLPPSERNVQFFELVNDIRSNTDIVYTSIGCTLIDSGIEIFSGLIVVKDVDVNITVQVIDRLAGFFKAIENLSLRDLDFGDTPVTWTASYIDSRRASTSGIVAPFIDYGQIDPTGAAIGAYYLPSVVLNDIVQAIAENAGYTISGDLMSLEHYTGAIMAYSYNGWPGTTFTMNQIMPDMQQSDFVKWLLVAFGAIFTDNGNALTLYRTEDIFNDAARAFDWTTKRVKEPDKITFQYGDYAKRNTFTANTPYENSNTFISGSIYIDNPQLSAESEIYESPMRIADDGVPLSSDATIVRGAYIGWWAEGNLPAGFPPVTEFDNEPEPTILLTRAKHSSEPSVSYNGTPRSDYRVAYGMWLQIGSSVINPLSTEWSSPGQTGWLDINYANLSRSLNRLRIVTRNYNLTIEDIYKIDSSKMIFDKDTHFMVLKIDKFIKGLKTKVLLLQRTFGEIANEPQDINVNPSTVSLVFTMKTPLVTVVT